MNNYENILVINLMHLGDLMLVTPVLRTLRANYPKARISLLADKKLADIVQYNKHIDECILIDKKGTDDKMPAFIWGDKSADEIAALIDNASKKERKKIVSGDVYQWAEDIARKNIEIYTWNPAGVAQLNPDTVELSTSLVNRQMRDAGYRLAYLLNLYFGK